MINDYLDDKEKIVIIAGAGISKDSPANLPSWWDYNFLLLKTINDLAASELPDRIHPLDQNKLEKYIPVVSVSDYIVRGAMGKSYFPLLRLLNSSQPNNNHYALAQLAKKRKIAAIITTNFDTLIEQAFDKLGVPYQLILDDKDYQDILLNDDCALLKIHGSVTSDDTLIDTITQKMKGLSCLKKEAIKRFFRKFPVFVLGFSGEDFRFDIDYIPISEALNYQSITWIQHPGKSVNPFVEGMLGKKNFILEEMKLCSFFENVGIMPYLNENEKDVDNPSFEEIALPLMHQVMDNPSFGGKGCLGLCLRLLDDMGEREKAIQYADIMMEQLKKEKIPYLGLPALILLFNIGIISLRVKNYDTALQAFHSELSILQESLDILKKNCPSDELQIILDEYGGNYGAVWTNIGLCHFYRDNSGDLELAKKAFNNAFREFTLAYNYGGYLLAAFNLVRCSYKSGLNANYYIKSLQDISLNAKDNGESNLFFDILSECIIELTKLGEYDSAWKYVGEAEKILEITISLRHNITLQLCKAELYIRRNQHKQCRDELVKLARLIDERNIDVNLGIQVRWRIIRCLGCYEEYKDLLIKSLLYLQQKLPSDEQYITYINNGLDTLRVHGRLFSQPLFLDTNSNSKMSKEDKLRKLIIFKEYYGELKDLPWLFYNLSHALVKDLLFRDEDLSYGFYMSTKRTECGILKYEAMLMYSNALAEAEKLDLAQKIVKELIDSPRISDEGYDTILGCAYGLMSYLLSVAGCEEEAEKRYIESLKLLRDHPDDRKVTVYKRAHSFARNGFLKKSMDTLLSDMPAGTMTKETAEKIVGDWKIKYENK